MSHIRNEARELFATTLDFLADDFAVVFLEFGVYAFTGEPSRLDDITAGVVDTIPVTSGKSATNGVLTADDPAPWTFPTPGQVIFGAWFFHDTGVAATSELLAFYDRRRSGLAIHYVVPAGPSTIRWPADAFGQGFITL